MTTNLEQEERTDRPEFNTIRDDEGRLYLRIFSEGHGLHLMVECDESDPERLRKRLARPPLPIATTDE